MSGQDLGSLESELLGSIAAAADLAAIETVRISALGRKGRIPELMSTLGKMPPEQRKSFGAEVNQLKARVGRDVSVDLTVDPAILGGLVVKIGSQMIDSSIKTRLNTLAHAMKG